MNIKYEENYEVKESYDIIVAGGGVAGVAAALAGARCGKKVLLIEKSISLGGLATTGLVNWFVPMCNGRGTQIIKGMADEFLRLATKHGFDTLSDEWKNGEPGAGAKTRLASKFSAPIFILELTKLLTESGVDLLFDTVVSKPLMDGNKCTGLLVENKSGRQFYGAKIIVDTTGDADILYRAGVPTVQGKNYHTFYGTIVNEETAKNFIDTKDVSKITDYFNGGTATLFGDRHPENIECYTGTSSEEVNRYIITNHLEMLEKLEDGDRMTRDLIQLPSMCQFRTTRHIDGDYTLKVEDMYRHFDDSVGAICDFVHKDYIYEVSYGTLIRKEFPNLITAGRSASAEGFAWDVLRVIPPAIITGQAAGVAAAVAVDEEKPLCDIDIKVVQNILEKQNVMIHFDDDLVPQNKGESGEAVDLGHIE